MAEWSFGNDKLKSLPERPEPPKIEPEIIKPTLPSAPKASSVEISNNTAKELMEEIQKLRDKVETMEKKFEREVASMESKYEAKLVEVEDKFQSDINDLTTELDDEKKERMKLEVEVKRLKKEKTRGSRVVGDS